MAHELFTRTHWTVVLAAAQHDTRSSGALAELCQAYWYPLYAHVRAWGYGPEEAKDLTQKFFAHLIANGGLHTISPDKGKFRCFLLASINHLLCDERDHAWRQKRSGGQPVICLDSLTAEERYRLEPAENQTPENIFERRWALALLEEALKRLEQEYASAGKAHVFAVLHSFLTGRREECDYSAAAQQLGISEGNARVAVHRLKKRYGPLFRTVVAETLSPHDDLDTEVQHVRAVLSR